jgi:hypothetical protein
MQSYAGWCALVALASLLHSAPAVAQTVAPTASPTPAARSCDALVARLVAAANARQDHAIAVELAFVDVASGNLRRGSASLTSGPTISMTPQNLEVFSLPNLAGTIEWQGKGPAGKLVVSSDYVELQLTAAGGRSTSFSPSCSRDAVTGIVDTPNQAAIVIWSAPQ